MIEKEDEKQVRKKGIKILTYDFFLSFLIASPLILFFVLNIVKPAEFFHNTGLDTDNDKPHIIKPYIIEQLTRAANGGNISAQYNLGVFYEQGQRVAQNYKTAVKWYRLAAEQGDRDAQVNLGKIYEIGLGVPQDYKTAVKWYRLAAEQGHAKSQFILGLLHEKGLGVPQNDKTAVKWYTLAAEQGDAKSQYTLGVMYRFGQGVPQNDKTAVKWYSLAAEQGYASAQYFLEEMYASRKGWGWSYGEISVGECANAPRNYQGGSLGKPYVIDRTGTQDVVVKLQNRNYKYPQIRDFYRIEYLSEKLDICFGYHIHPDAVVIDNRSFFDMPSEKEINKKQIFVTILSNVNCGAPCGYGIAHTFSFSVNTSNDRHFYEAKSFEDEHSAKTGIAVFPPPKFLSRLSVKETQEYEVFRKMRESASGDFKKGLTAAQSGDFATALREWTPLAEQGNATAQYNLGLMFEKGRGVPQNYKTAVKWWKLAAQQGIARAQTNLGVMYEKGQGVSQNDKTAVKWYRLAAEQGHANAQGNLGFMYHEGKGVSQDYKTAVKWYTLAAEQGNSDAQFSLGVMYDKGRGVSQNYKTAMKWYTLGAEQGHASAQNNLGQMYRTGRGVSQNDKTSVKWYRLAAEQGYANAQGNLGVMYAFGKGVLKDYIYAHMWGNIAATNGNELGAKLRDDFEKKMTPAQIAKAQKLARECIRKKYKGC